MAVNKVIFEGQTLIDLTDSTVESVDLNYGKVAYNKAGVRVIGSAVPSMTLQGASVQKITGTTDDYALVMSST